MELKKLERLLKDYKRGSLDHGDLLEELKVLPFAELGHAKIDHHRSLRLGFPEVIYGEGKKLEHLLSIIGELLKHYRDFIATRISSEQAEAVREKHPSVLYFPDARILTFRKPKPGRKEAAVLCAGTADFSVAEEAAVTLEILGAGVERIYDVGVSGIHRLVPKLKTLNSCRIIIVVAGMEGALPSVVAGMTGKPIIGVPTSVGYGTSFKGLAPLLTMLNSCTPNVSVVNIDNGFGAAFFARLVIGERSNKRGVRNEA